MSLTEILIDLSYDDLDSARLLYQHRQYRTSYFSFQQAAEKANKAFGLFSETISEKELLDIQHNQTKIHRKALVEQEKKADTFTDAIKILAQLGDHSFFGQIDVTEYKNT